jgi:single-strand DNA-binding protein
MKNLTSIITFEGNLAADPELRITPAGHAVADLTVLVNTSHKVGDEWVEDEPTRHRCTVWGAPAENVAESLRKGDRVLVAGDLTTEAWKDKDNNSRTTVKITVRAIGASLRYHTARVVKAERTTAQDRDEVGQHA